MIGIGTLQLLPLRTFAYLCAKIIVDPADRIIVSTALALQDSGTGHAIVKPPQLARSFFPREQPRPIKTTL